MSTTVLDAPEVAAAATACASTLAPADNSAPDAAAASDSPAMDAYWMPFTANRQFKKAPRLF